MISNQKTNKTLKEIGRICGFNKKLTFAVLDIRLQQLLH